MCVSFLCADTDDWLYRLIGPLVANGGCNGCIIYWLKLANMSSYNYFQISKLNTHFVANYLSEIIIQIVEVIDLDITKFVFMGHSLGTIVMSVAAIQVEQYFAGEFIIDLFIGESRVETKHIHYPYFNSAFCSHSNGRRSTVRELSRANNRHGAR